jgi:imidazolonepropionase-like amidohydrolase
VRDVGGSWPHSLADAERVMTLRQPGPSFLLAEEIFEGKDPVWGDGFHVVETAAEAEALLDHRTRHGLDLVKVYPTLPRAIRVPLLVRARQRGLPSTGHADDLALIVNSIADGLTCFEHTPGSPIRGDVLALMVAAKVAWCPTLCVMGGGDHKLRREAGELSEPRFTQAVPGWQIASSRASPYYAWSSDRNLEQLLDERCRMVARASRAGVPILVGTDAPNNNCFHGPSSHWELEFLVRGGLSAAEALRAATVLPARVYGLPQGEVAPGATADLVLLAKDPLADIRNTHSIECVVQRGWVRSPDELLRAGAR